MYRNNCRNKIQYHIDYFTVPVFANHLSRLKRSGAKRRNTSNIQFYSIALNKRFLLFSTSQTPVSRTLTLKTSASVSSRVLNTFIWTAILFKTQKLILRHNCGDAQHYLCSTIPLTGPHDEHVVSDKTTCSLFCARYHDRFLSRAMFIQNYFLLRDNHNLPH